MQVYSQGTCFNGQLIQPGETAGGALLVQPNRREEETQHVKVTMFNAWPFFGPYTTVLHDSDVSIAPGEWKTIPVVAQNVPLGGYSLKIEVGGNKNPRYELAAGLMAIPH